MSDEQVRLQVPPKLFGVNSWIPQMIRQWIPDCWSGDRKCTGPKGATANSRNWLQVCRLQPLQCHWQLAASTWATPPPVTSLVVSRFPLLLHISFNITLVAVILEYSSIRYGTRSEYSNSKLLDSSSPKRHLNIVSNKHQKCVAKFCD